MDRDQVLKTSTGVFDQGPIVVVVLLFFFDRTKFGRIERELFSRLGVVRREKPSSALGHF